MQKIKKQLYCDFCMKNLLAHGYIFEVQVGGEDAGDFFGYGDKEPAHFCSIDCIAANYNGKLGR